MKTSILLFLGFAALSSAAPAPIPDKTSSWGSANGKKGSTSSEGTPVASSRAQTSKTVDHDTDSGSSGNSTMSGLTLPSGCMKKNNLAVGWLPNEDSGEKMAAITSKLGGPSPCFYGLYSQISNAASYDGSQLTSRIADVKSSGAILQAAVMPTKVKFSQVDSKLAGQVCGAMKKFTDQGVEVWLRFAHEFNWYVTDGTYAGGSPQEFVTMWKTIASACRSNDKIKMYWSPNNVGNDASKLAAWWPGADTVDVVGIDVYPKPGTDFTAAYGAFYDAFAKKYNKPFYIGETGQIAGDAAKKQWLQDLVQPKGSYPLYGGFAWFEYNKPSEGDFRVVTGDQDLAKQVLLG